MFVTVDVTTMEVCIMCSDLYSYQILCHAWIICYFSAVKPGAKQNITRPPSGFIYCARVFPKKNYIFQTSVAMPCLGSQTDCFTVTCTLQVCALLYYVYWLLANWENGIMVSSIGIVFLPSCIEICWNGLAHWQHCNLKT